MISGSRFVHRLKKVSCAETTPTAKKSASLLRVIESGSVQRAVFMDEVFIYSKDRLVFFKIYLN
jgi:hypothetical protein